MKSQKVNLLVLILFVVLTLLMTYPTVLKMGTSVRDLGDPLLNTWIMAWNAKAITHLDFKDYFNANIFFPHKRTLAYSEFLIPQSLVALPALLVSKNPIFAYNFILLLSFLTSGFGAYLLARYLTSSTSGGIIAGVIYAFSPFMFHQLGHLQVITAGGIPLALLFLHKFFLSERYKHLLLFTLFFLLQILANGYYAMYLSLFAGLYILLYVVTRNKYKDWEFWLKMALFVCIVFAVAGPFFSQYFLLREEMGFVRHGIGSSASLTSFLATAPMNRIYGNLTSVFLKPESALFPGVLAFMLAAVGFIRSRRWNKTWKPLVRKYTIIYSVILFISFLFTFGSKGPYILLFKYVPGFNGLRVASRFHIFVMLSIAVLAAFGIKSILSVSHSKKKFANSAIVLLVMLILLEYLSIPLPMDTVPAKENIPEVYKWLKAEKGDFALLELPLPKLMEERAWIESPRLYYSTYHWKKLVNGISGYFPLLYSELRRRWEREPLEHNIHDLQTLGVKYIILHSSLYEEEELNRLMSDISKLHERIKFVARVDEAYVYEMEPLLRESAGKVLLGNSKTIPNTEWSASSNVNKGNVKYVLDGDISTRWHIGGREFDVYFEFDLGDIYHIKGLSMKSGSNSLHYPRSYRVEVSADGIEWTVVTQEENSLHSITDFLTPKEISLDIAFPAIRARYIKFINTEKKVAERYWSIYDIEFFE
ncbi:discoidin domain-containing protein [Acidobacteriota bacterium]